MNAQIRRWLDDEQTVNERLIDESVHAPIDDRSNTVKAAYRPERRGVWEQQVVWLPADRSRTYGPLHEEFHRAFGLAVPEGRTPLLVHPQPPQAHRIAGRTLGCAALAGVSVTPTASYRSLLAWAPGRTPVVVKLSLGATVGRSRRTLREPQIARALMLSRLLELVPSAERERFGLDWFAETAGAAEVESGLGWLLRRLPRVLAEPGEHHLVPFFSLISRSGQRHPLLVDLIHRSGMPAERFVLEKILAPYVRALAHLLFEEGIQIAGHGQNLFVELDDTGSLTGRLVLRDLSDASVSLAMRLARRKPLPDLAPQILTGPTPPPFPLMRIVMDYFCNFGRPWLYRAYDTVELFGLSGFVRPMNHSLQRFFQPYAAERIEHAYLALWQDAAVAYLRVKPLYREKPRGLATDEALAYYLRQTDWKSLGSVGGATLPEAAEPIKTERRIRRQKGPAYERLECAWGDLYLMRGLPAFFRPAV